MGVFSKELKNEFETAVFNEPSVFEPLKVCCICFPGRNGTTVSQSCILINWTNSFNIGREGCVVQLLLLVSVKIAVNCVKNVQNLIKNHSLPYFHLVLHCILKRFYVTEITFISVRPGPRSYPFFSILNAHKYKIYLKKFSFSRIR